MDFLKIFEDLLSHNVSDKIEKKPSTGGIELNYLSWSYAVAEFTKKCPNFTYEIKMFDNKPYIYDDNLGYMVFTSITVDNTTKDMWLPVMDGSNKAMKKQAYTYKTKYGEKVVEPATMFDVNKAIMRCLVKNMAMFGLGLYIYAGEDLPETTEEQNTIENVKKTFPQAKEVKTPTLEEITNIMIDNNYTLFTAQEFYNYYSSKNWKTSEGKPITNVKNLLKACEDRKKKQMEDNKK